MSSATITPPAITPPASRPHWYQRPAVLIAASALIAGAAVGATLGALAGGGPPADAAAMVRADGYTLAYDFPPAQIRADFGPAAPYVTSAAAGTSATGNAEIDVCFTPAGITALGPAATALIRANIPGSAVTISGDALRADIPAAAVARAGGLGQP